MNRWTSRAVLGVGAAAATCCLLALSAGPALAAAPASAAPAAPASPATLQVIKTLSSSFVLPLQFAVAGPLVVVADSGTSTLSVVGWPKPIATGPSPASGGDLAGVGLNPATRSLAYTTSTGDHSSTKLTILQWGRKPVVADLSGFEKRMNPDGRVHYGVDHPSTCVTQALTAAQIPVSYTGQVDSHPYAVAALGDGAWAVADAGGNDVLKVDRYGHVSLIAVLPAQPLRVTAAVAAGLGLPSCVVGITYKFEPVPTDVEVGPRGVLYVTTLPGGPGAPAVPVYGSVYRIDRGGPTARVATGFFGATNLAIDPHGTIYVAELNAGRISRIECGRRETVANLPGVVAVEFANGHLYASTAPAALGLSGPGTIVELGHKAAS